MGTLLEGYDLKKKLQESLKEVEKERRISDKAKAYLVEVKGFSPEFVEALPYATWKRRTDPIFNSLEVVKKAIIALGYTYEEKINGFSKGKDKAFQVYRLGQIPPEFLSVMSEEDQEFFKNLPTVEKLVREENNPILTELWRKHQGYYWLGKKSYYGIVEHDEQWAALTEEQKEAAEKNARNCRKKVQNFAFEYVPGMNSDKLRDELRRFTLTVRQIVDDNTSLELLKDEAIGEIEPEDTSRNRDVMAKLQAYAEIKKDPVRQLEFELTRTLNKMLVQADPGLDPRDLNGEDDNPTVLSIFEISEKMKSVINVEYDTVYKDGKSVSKKMNDWNRLTRFWRFFEDGRISREELQFICLVSDKSFDAYLKAKQEDK